MDIFCGIDFGTTNTVVSISSRKGQLIDSFSLPTTIFIPFANQGIGNVYVGKEAIKEYEEGKSGRFIHSIKRSLSDPYLQHTTINRTYVKLEKLICLFLFELKKLIYDRWCIVPDNIVLGRPVKFSTIEKDNKMANERLLKSFQMAGFKQIVQLEEPVAASLCFEEHFSDSDKHFLIMDLGGGTSDFSLVERDSSKNGIDKYKIKSIDGINIGGDNFDEEIMYSSLSPILGIDATFESFDKRLPMPVHLYKEVSKWNAMHLFDRKKLANEFSDYLYKSDNPVAIHRLRAIIENKLSHNILEKVRLSKHELSKKIQTTIEYNEFDLGIKVPVDQNKMTEIMASSIDSVFQVMKDMIENEHSIETTDKIILTGGSSRVHSIGTKVKAISGEKKVLMDDNFYDSVSKGLSLYAYYKNISINT